MVKMVHPCSVVVAWRVSGILVWYQGSLVGLGSILHVGSQTSTTLLLTILHDSIGTQRMSTRTSDLIGMNRYEYK